VHTYDILGRPTAGLTALPPDATPFVLHRVTCPDGLLAAAPGERDWAVIELLRRRVPPFDRRLRDSQLRRRADRFARGDVAYVAVADGDVAAWAWVSLASEVHCRWSGLRFHLQPGEAYLYDLWAFPGRRAGGAGAFVMRGLIDDLHRTGSASQVYGYVLSDNRASQVLHRLGLGFEQVQEVRAARLLSRWAWQLPFSADPPSGPCTARSAGPRAQAEAA
jgi:hypothetical protein